MAISRWNLRKISGGFDCEDLKEVELDSEQKVDPDFSKEYKPPQE